ncbi:NAD P-binding protein [Gloeophyllum trabeum ATCC 11539]|uniref:NAD P-binding protein n=1 Tax=Gloeophyllum trabeum (strain ATCC 11539 / FP-39264 / Madison 617) TaxID=670483 RepID=S7QI00_GLOTA|nr:NAD P-binding protein [Gloeophyllum trabeum ATCC 11539]EPQ58827.1 NAD P-binding protein [Gloeophyllum trabeum ATCC 11539]
MPERLVWLITGTSSGIGRELAIAALARGDQVIATARARSMGALTHLKEKGAALLELDVTGPLDLLERIAAAAVKIYGRIDVLVNNAGEKFHPPPVDTIDSTAGAVTAFGVIEDQTPEDTIGQFNTNLLGPLNVTRAFLPYMRERKSGTVVWIGSVGAYTRIINCGLYCATKAAMIRLSEVLNAELQPFGVRSIYFEFGYFRTEMTQPERQPPLNQRIPAYKEIAEKWDAEIRAVHGKQPGCPKKGAQVVVDVIRGEGPAAGRDIHNTMAVGSDVYGVIEEECVATLKRLQDWKEVTQSTDVEDAGEGLSA